MPVSRIVLKGDDQLSGTLRTAAGGIKALISLFDTAEMSAEAVTDATDAMYAGATAGLSLVLTVVRKVGMAAISATKKVVRAAGNLVKKALKLILDFAKKVLKTIMGIPKALLSLPGNILDFFSKLGNVLTGLASGVGLLDKLTTGVENFISGAAELEGVNAAFLAIAGEGAPALLAEMRKFSGGMVEDIKLMKNYNLAAFLLGKTLAADLAPAYESLSKIAVATEQDMDFLIDSLVRGIGRLSPKILDNLGVQTNLAEITAYATEMFGKEATALSIVEEQQAALALVTEKLAFNTVDLADATGTLTGLMAIYKAQQAGTARLLGSIFIPAAKEFYLLLIKTGEGFRKAITEGGSLYDILRKLSATVAGFLRSLGDLADTLMGPASDAVSNFADKMYNLARDAFLWGVNFITQFAIGIAEGAAKVLTKVINWLSGFFARWMAPSSPPKFLPKIRDWGRGLIEQYALGITDGSSSIINALTQVGHDVLDVLQAPLMGILRLGDFDNETIGDLFGQISREIAAAIAGGGMTESLWDLLQSSAGEYADELLNIFNSQMAVADAATAILDAETRLADARRREESSSRKLSTLAREYNQLIKAGASQAALNAKLKEMRAESDSLKDARAAAIVAEDDLEIAKERHQEAVELARLQSTILQQLLEIAQAEAMVNAAAAGVTPGGGGGGGGGGADGVVPDIVLPGLPPISSIDAGMDDMITRMTTKFTALWDQVIKDFNDSDVGKLIEILVATWEASPLKVVWDEFSMDVTNQGLMTAVAEFAGTVWDALREALGLGPNFTWEKVYEWGEMEEGTGNFVRYVTGVYNKMSGKITWEDFKETGAAVVSAILESITKAFGVSRQITVIDERLGLVKFETIGEAIVRSIKEALTKAIIDTDWEAAGMKVGEALADSINAILTGGSDDPLFDAGIKAAKSFISGFVQSTDFEEALNDLVDRFGDPEGSTLYEGKGPGLKSMVPSEMGGLMRAGRDLGRDVAKSIMDGMKSEFGIGNTELITQVTEAAQLFIDTYKEVMEIEETSGVFEVIGAAIVSGLNAGLNAGESSFKSIFDDMRTEIEQFITWFEVDVLDLRGDKSFHFKMLGEAMVVGMHSGLQGMAGVFRGPAQWAINSLQEGMNRIIDAVNAMIIQLNKTGYVTGATIPHLHLPGLAEGGLVQDNMAALLHGNEMVLPLEDPRTRDLLADALRGAMESGGGGGARVQIVNHFNKDSIRSKRDIVELGNEIMRQQRLRGVRGIA